MAVMLEEFLKAMREGKKPGVSKYQMRDEFAQERQRRVAVPRLKREVRKRAKLCLFREIALPWNPVTGEEDETYNEHNKYRPTTSVTTTIKLLKAIANKYPESKEALARFVGYSADEWDTSDENEITQMDKTIFKPHIQVRVFTLQTAKVNIPAMTGAFGREYKINVTRNPETLAYEGDLPLLIRANQFMRALAYEELSAYNKRIEAGEISPTESEKRDYIRDIFAKVVVQEPGPSNHIMGCELPLSASCSFEEATVDAVRHMTADSIRKQAFVTRYSENHGKGIKDAIEEYKAGRLPKYDKHLDYYEIDMKCPMEQKDQNNKGEVGLNTVYEKPEYLIGSDTLEKMESDNPPVVDSSIFDKALCEYLDSTEDVERMILNSVGIGTYNEDVERQLLMALPTVIDLESPYLTKAVITAHKDFLIEVFGEVGEELVARVEEDMSNKSAGDYTPEAADQAQKTLNLAELLNDNTEESIELEELDA